MNQEIPRKNSMVGYVKQGKAMSIGAQSGNKGHSQVAVVKGGGQFASPSGYGSSSSDRAKMRC